MNPVREFLEKGDYTFDEGVAVLLCFSTNRGVNDFIVNSRDKRHLHYELARLSRHPRLDPIPGRKLPDCLKKKAAAPKVEEPAEPANPAATEQIPPMPSVDDTDTDDGEEDTTTFLDLQHHKYTRLEDMPTPLTKELWVKNSDEYKELQHCHQMMKEANSDAGRADWRKKVHQLSQSIKDRWKLIDSEIERYQAEAEAKAKAEAEAKPGEKKPAFNPINARAYISKALKEETWDDALKVEVQRRVDELLANDVTIGKDTRKRLAERGISL